MKLKTFAITQRDDGLEVSVVGLLPGANMGDTAAAFAAINAFSPRAEASRDPAVTVVEIAADMPGLAEAFGETRRRRHRNPLAEQAAVRDELIEDNIIAPAAEAAPEAQASPTRRRRRSADGATDTAPSAASSPSATGQSDANPTQPTNSPTSLAPSPEQPTRRRRAAPAEAASATSAAAPTPADTSPRRRRAAPGAATSTAAASTSSAAPASSDEKISDADLSKACSDAARVLTPKAVMEYLASTFKVKHAGELKGADRRKFLDGIKAKREEAS